MREFLDRIRKKVEETKEREKKVLQRLNFPENYFPENYGKGSSFIWLGWMEVEELLNMAEEGYMLKSFYSTRLNKEEGK